MYKEPDYLKRCKMYSRREILYKVANRVVMIVGSVIFGWLLWYAARYTHYMVPLEVEKSLVLHDSTWINILAVILFFSFFSFLVFVEKKISKRVQNVIVCGVIFIAVVWTWFVCRWWVCAVERTPEADQLYLSAAASYLLLFSD